MVKEDLYTMNLDEADYILAVGDRKETFDFVLERFRENKPIIHLWAGEKTGWTTHDDVYRYAITFMSMMQLCTNGTAFNVVNKICRATGKEMNIHVIGNVMLDNLEIDEANLPDNPYDLVLYNPPTRSTKDKVMKDLLFIMDCVSPTGWIWLPPNGDKYSDIIMRHVTHENLPRSQFLGLLKNCNKFFTNSSCQYYEAQFLLKPNQIIQVGKRNLERDSKHSNMAIKGASDKIIKLLKELK